MAALTVVLALLVAAGCAYGLLSLLCVARFFRRDADRSGAAGKGAALPVSILKPLRGPDPSGADNLSSFCAQDYPVFETLFGFRDEDDPALPLVREIVQKNAGSTPGRARVVVRREGTGANRKVLNLEALAAEARYPLLAISDGDMCVGNDYLRRVVGEFARDESTGMVTCLYKISAPSTIGSALESYAIALDFVPSVLVGRRVEGVRFGLGASMLVSKTALRAIGGLAALREYLADDYQLGFRLWEKGYTNVISTYVIENRVGDMSLREHLLHQIRWARTCRASRPAGYFGFGITHAFFFALLLLAIAPSPWSAGALAAVLALRCAVAFTVYARVIRTKAWLRWLPLLPLKDLLGFFFWVWSFAGSTVLWRGDRYRLLRGGKMERA